MRCKLRAVPGILYLFIESYHHQLCAPVGITAGFGIITFNRSPFTVTLSFDTAERDTPNSPSESYCQHSVA
jgi:hypothetical protein